MGKLNIGAAGIDKKKNMERRNVRIKNEICKNYFNANMVINMPYFFPLSSS